MSMGHVSIDSSIQRVEIDGFAFPLGVYPAEPIRPAPAYRVEFEAADGGESFWYGKGAEDIVPGAGAGPGAGATGDDGELEEWPDRFMYDIFLSATRLPPLCRALFALLPGRVYPILDILGHDAYREVDPYIAYDLVGIEKFYDGVAAYGDWFFEDGLVGFGAMSLDPFIYIFLDEHKVLTVRVQLDLKEPLERLLQAFDLAPAEQLTTVDSALHEHRSVLADPASDPSSLTADDLIENLRDQWLLQLNVDAFRNVNDEGAELGVTPWRCIARCTPEGDGPDRYLEILLTADSLDAAERLAFEAADEHEAGDSPWSDVVLVATERMTAEDYEASLGRRPTDTSSVRVDAARWADDAGAGGGAAPKQG